MQPPGCGAGPAAAPLPLLVLAHVLLCCRPSFSLALAESLIQLPVPHNPKIHLYNLEQVLSWDPVPISNLSSPVLYSVQYKYSTSSYWEAVQQRGVNCTRITEPRCNFTAFSHPFFPTHFLIFLRVKAEVGELNSDWAVVPGFQHFRNATIGTPLDVVVTALSSSLIISLKPPFKEDYNTFHYYVYYWEKKGKQKVKSLFDSTPIHLEDLKASSEYCLQVQAVFTHKILKVPLEGLLSNEICHKTSVDASTKFQQTIIVILGIFASMILLVLCCYFLAQRFQGLIKYCFHSPPGIPSQIKEYLKDPNEPVLEALDKNSSMKEDFWDSVSVVSCTEENQAVFNSNL